MSVTLEGFEAKEREKDLSQKHVAERPFLKRKTLIVSLYFAVYYNSPQKHAMLMRVF